jgi:hypothetical protein
MKLPSSSRNWITIIGALISGLNLILIILLFIVSTIFNKNNTNLGLFIYIILPGFFVLGLIMIPVGIIIARKKIRALSDDDKKRLPVVDLNDPKSRNAFIIFTVFTIFILFLSTYGSFSAYHLTESVEFCGTLCHKVMEPEHTAYQNSPHANVTCVECHVGSGASWYIKSKLSGLHQVYAVLTKTYPTPISTPLHDLRPARETCEKCHWPQKFYPRTIQTNRYYLADSLNTEWDLILQMKVGPENKELGFNEGIHWHINPSVKIEYTSENDKREVINYVKYTNIKTGKVIIFKNPETEVTDSSLARSETRSMDCIDCHNRPSHNYNSPPIYFDKAMLNGSIHREIPFIKKTAMGILKNSFNNKDSALLAIKDQILGFYKNGYPEFYSAHSEIINESAESIQNAYSKNTFPAMKVSYDVYPEHIGHLESEGCFRCHNDSFTSDDGEKIRKDCDLCHTIMGQGKPGNMQYSTIKGSLEFNHPVDIGTAWKEANCSECHRYLF